jgi:hypothetical protein
MYTYGIHIITFTGTYNKQMFDIEKIPKVINIWCDGKFTEWHHKSITSFQLLHPTWELQVWCPPSGDADKYLSSVITTHLPPDHFALQLLEKGGVWAHANVLYIQSLNNMLIKSQGQDACYFVYDHLISSFRTEFIVAEPECNLISDLLSYLQRDETATLSQVLNTCYPKGERFPGGFIDKNSIYPITCPPFSNNTSFIQHHTVGIHWQAIPSSGIPVWWYHPILRIFE